VYGVNIRPHVGHSTVWVQCANINQIWSHPCSHRQNIWHHIQIHFVYEDGWQI